MDQVVADVGHAEPDDVDRRQSALLDAVRRGRAVGDPDGDLWRVDWATDIDLDLRLIWQVRVGRVVASAWGEVDGRPQLATAVRADERPPADPKLRRHRLEVRDVRSGRVRTVECEVPVRVLAFAPDATEPLLISSHDDHTVRIWALADLALRRTIDVGESPHALAVLGSGPDTRLLVSTAWSGLGLWDLATGARLRLPHLPPVIGLSPGALADGSAVVLLSDEGVLLWNPDDDQVRQLPVPAGLRPIKGATLWRSDGRELLTVRDEQDAHATIDLTTGQHELLTAHLYPVPDRLMQSRPGLGPQSNPTVTGPALAVSTRWNVHLWDARTMRPLGPPLAGSVARAAVEAVRWEGRDLLLTSSEQDGVVALWDPAASVDRKPGHGQRLADVTVTEPDGVVVSVDEGGTLVVRRAADGTLLAAPLATEVVVTRALAAWSDGGRPYAATGSGSPHDPDPLLYRWDLAAGGPSGAPARTDSSIVRWAVHRRLRTGDALVVYGDGDITLRNPADGAVLATIPVDAETGTTGFAVGAVDGRATVALTSYEEPARLFDLDDPSSAPEIVPGTEDHPVLALLDGRLVTVRSEDAAEGATALRAWDRTGRPAGPEIDGPAAVTAVAGLGWPELYVARADRTLTLIDLRTGEPSTRPLLLPGAAVCLAATADGGVAVGFGQDIALVRPPIREGD
ncbi:WD40 repeat domain-containing protein [Kitasatospora sp. NBC_01539]|uniref:WD40 repeat domain-containing protein n=1 Tax=Kitasatospora sp. NBC_01539 TaxID=2903577 RepID=UPI0038601C12